MSFIYLDHHATTPVDPVVFDEMKPYFLEAFGNVSSNHAFGWRAREAVEESRQRIARLLSCESREIVFTSGATESNNLAILGIARANEHRGNHIIVSNAEHKSVLEACGTAQKEGFDVTFLPVDKEGRVSPDQVEAAITAKTILISLLLANNEIGTLNPIDEIGKIARKNQIPLHTDATQGAGLVDLDVHKLHVDLLSLSAHKMYGPKGVGALFIKKQNPRLKLSPLFFGGTQETGLRPGTLNVPGIVGFGKAAEIAFENRETFCVQQKLLADQLKDLLVKALPEIQINGDPVRRLPNNLHVSFQGIDGQHLHRDLSRGIAVSSGAACTATSTGGSHVLQALGLPETLAFASVRFGLGRSTTREDVDLAAEFLITTVGKLRQGIWGGDFFLGRRYNDDRSLS